MDHQTSQRILEGNASEKEKEAFYKELEENSEAKKEFTALKELWNLYHISHHRLSLERKKQLFHEFKLTVQRKNRKTVPQLLLNATKYAAVILLALCSGFYLHALQNPTSSGTLRELHSENGSISSVVLEDGSKIWLNSNTTLVMLEEKSKVTAKLNGEAYFEIKHDPKREFIVDLGKIKVKDLGTKFNISAYPEDQFYRTTLIEGDVTILNAEEKEINTLAINQTFRFSPDDLSSGIEKLDPSVVTGWTSNKFVFIDKPLEEICQEFEKWYGVSMIIKDEHLKHEKYTSVIRRTTTIGQMLEMFRLTTGINYKFENEENESVIVSISK
jgi:ferric-dicitrate binding protein FerR (iron transport regulator)